MNYTPIIIFLVLMAATWLGAYIAGRAGYMKYEKELLREAREKEKAASKERKATTTVQHGGLPVNSHELMKEDTIRALDNQLSAYQERLKRMHEYLVEDPNSELIKSEIAFIEEAIKVTQQSLKNVIEN